ncbi:MAG TPA: NAD-dependent succinate-semialdehyde dehydrogenase [Sphingobacterium sp.]|nr:NAD-dependent succinate-semialdehyde dehydrogenase [Sphingobacterium sp.]
MESFKDIIFTRSYINGEWVEREETFDVFNPYTEERIVSLADASEEQWEEAVQAAHNAFEPWKRLTAKERSSILLKWYDLLQENKEKIAGLMSLESGKVIGECLSEVDYGASFIQWFGEEAKRVYGLTIPEFSVDRRVKVIRQPIGVVAAITPWNFPLAMITRKIAPALAVGCTVVIRPSSVTPLTALALSYYAEKAGFPKGVINTIVNAEASQAGKFLCGHPHISKISFTGSTEVGKILAKQSASTLKKVSLELGGNAPLIVFKDADIKNAVESAITAKFRFAGQTCVCINRILVHRDIYNHFTKKLTEEVQKLKTGDPSLKENQIGPLISKEVLPKMERFIKDAQEKGGEILCGGTKEKNNIFSPTVIGNANHKMRFAQEEIFGPIAPIFKFDSFEEAIHMANDTIYGLAAYLYTDDINTAIRASEQLQYGMIGINEGLISSETVPFGGIKESGYGREGSKYGIEDYTQLKYICTGNVR